VAFERVPAFFRDAPVVRARPVQTADDSDMHGKSTRLIVVEICPL
jgi:hypothetical protein